jgi:uncharacterized RDD family membrane protein YckC
MNWYYVEAGQQTGPVDDAQLEELARSGKIQPETLVWREGMANWQPYSQAKPGGAAAPAGAPPVYAAAPAAGGDQVVCAECNGVFNVQDTIAYGNIRVCANCKPVFMQKLAEGARLNTGELNYAGFWTRFAAVFLDGLILGGVNMVLGLVAGLGIGQAVGAQPAGAIALQGVLMLIQLGIGLSYEVVMVGKYGATLGKMACKIKVVTAEGQPVSYPLALGRYFAKMLSGLICAIGYIMAGFDEERRALHDRICNTRVVMK